MIKKELLSAVLNEHIDRCDYKKELSFKNSIRYWNTPANTMPNIINIYELANLCKEWAFQNEHSLSTTKLADKEDEWFGKWDAFILENYFKLNLDRDDFHFIADTEPEAIFNACQYIYDYIKGK